MIETECFPLIPFLLRPFDRSAMASLLDRMHPRSCTCAEGFLSKGRSNDGDSSSKKRGDLHERVAMLLNDIGPSSSREDGSNDGSASDSPNADCRDEAANQKNPKPPEKKSTVRKRRLAATKSLYKLSNDRDNRVPLLCTSSIDVLPVLLSCLQTSSPSPDGKAAKLHEEDIAIRRLSCLILNNLSTPIENKAVMVLGEHSQDLLQTLVQVIETASPESHLCVICLYNLSFLDDAVDVLLNFSPGQEAAVEHMKASGHTADDEDSFGSPRSTSSTKISRHRRIGAKSIPCSPRPSGNVCCLALQNDHSLLRVLESMVRTYSPFLLSSVTSVEGEAVRWCVGLLCNFCKGANSPHHIEMILQTELIPHVVTNLGNTPRQMNQWAENSLEEFSLVLLCHLVKVKAGRDALSRTNVLDAIEPIIGKGGIHDHRAGVIRCALMNGEEDVHALSQWRKKVGSRSS